MKPGKRSFKVFLIAVGVAVAMYARADIIPSPVQAKGIIPAGKVNVQMVSEIVKVDLSLDSALVDCTFHMKNLGEAKTMGVGFPMMNFYLWENKYLDPSMKNKFQVFVRGQRIPGVSMFIPDKLKKELGGDQNHEFGGFWDEGAAAHASEPWYLWNMHFKRGEELVIRVIYQLPNGATKADRFFEYLLSTGAGWKGNIEDAKVIINLRDVPKDQILGLTPNNYNFVQYNQVLWHFKHFKPTVHNNIVLRYERVKGGYKAFRTKLYADAYINGKQGAFIDFEPDDVASFAILNNNIVVYTRAFALDSFKKKIREIDSSVYLEFRRQTVAGFPKKYELHINGSLIDTARFYERLLELDTIKINSINLKTYKNGRRSLYLNVKVRSLNDSVKSIP